MRAALFALLTANLVFFVWASWIDEPLETGGAPPSERLPVIALASEVPPENGPPAPTVQPAALRTAQRCITVGPFGDLTRAARAASMLRERGFAPQQRAEVGETWGGYWVYIDGLENAAEERSVLRVLERNGITDAHAMPGIEGGRRVSVGLFSERERAERRARAVERLGFSPKITERRQSGTVYWVDLDLDAAGASAVPTEGLLSLEEAGSRLEIRVCPGGATGPQAPATAGDEPPAGAVARAAQPG